MLANNKIWGIVPAAGSGRRMGGDIPKQYLSLSGKTLIERTLQRLLQIDSLTTITVAINPEDEFFSSLDIAAHPKITATHGGRERSDSVLAALISLEENASASDWVLVHDAARCCVRVEVIKNMLEELQHSQVGGILAVPASDTLKQVNKGKQIESTLDRSHIWQAQTPQLFRYGVLKQALEKALENRQAITDEASAVELLGYDVKICLGHYDNLKVTHPNDLAVAAMLLQQQSSEKNTT